MQWYTGDVIAFFENCGKILTMSQQCHNSDDLVVQMCVSLYYKLTEERETVVYSFRIAAI